MSRFRVLSLFFGLLLLAASVQAQTRLPLPQRIAYEMDIRVDTEPHQYDGWQRVTYYNNAPDTLTQIFYHLYFNAFEPGSMMAERNRHLPDPDGRIVPRIFHLSEEEAGWHRVASLTQDGQPLAFDINDTVLRAELAQPIPPGSSAVFEMRFRAQVPRQTRRSGWMNTEGVEFSMTQWYPKVAGYDARGWHPDPYVGREFYAPFGTFDVRITLPSDYLIGATGTLQNADQIGHGYSSAPTPNTDSLTWHFRAENVHDFAWAADPDFVHERIVGDDGTLYHLLYQPDVAQGWSRMDQWVPQIIEFFSDQYGDYPYPQFTVIQGGDGGMEYPMITLIRGTGNPLGVTAHEAAHMWFYGVLASNEADYAWMDEGFTNYATAEAVAHVLGRPRPSHQGSMQSILFAHEQGIFERLNTPSDWFERNTMYGIASYSGGAMIADLLGYVIGEEQRDQWFKEYFRRYQYDHPGPYEVEKAAEAVSGLRLDWFFEQFTNTDYRYDVELDDFSSRQQGGRWHTVIEIENEDRAIMPVDLRLTFDDGSTQWVNIPLGLMEGHKPVPDDWIVAEPWHWTFPEYTLEVETDRRVVKAEIDPLLRTPDYNRLNNNSDFPLEVSFLQAPSANWDHYSVGVTPMVGYADNFGFGGGIQAKGLYHFGKYPLRAQVHLWPEVIFSDGEDPDVPFLAFNEEPPSFVDGIDYWFRFTQPARRLGPQATLALEARKQLGIFENRADLRLPLHRWGADTQHTLTFSILHQYARNLRTYQFDDGVPVIPLDHTVAARLEYRHTRPGFGLIAEGEFGGPLFGDNFSSPFFSSTNRLLVTALGHTELGPVTGLVRFQFGMGSDRLLVSKMFRLGYTAYEDQWRHVAYRSISSSFDVDLTEDRSAIRTGHFGLFSGIGPVAYVYSAIEGTGFLSGTPIGTRMLATTLAIRKDDFSRRGVLAPLGVEGFIGVGTVWNARLFGTDRNFEDFLADAGLGLSYDVSRIRQLRRWTAQSDLLSGLQLAAKFPLWVSDPDYIEPGSDAFAFRWLIGIQADL